MEYHCKKNFVKKYSNMIIIDDLTILLSNLNIVPTNYFWDSSISSMFQTGC